MHHQHHNNNSNTEEHHLNVLRKDTINKTTISNSLNKVDQVWDHREEDHPRKDTVDLQDVRKAWVAHQQWEDPVNHKCNNNNHNNNNNNSQCKITVVVLQPGRNRILVHRKGNGVGHLHEEVHHKCKANVHQPVPDHQCNRWVTRDHRCNKCHK